MLDIPIEYCRMRTVKTIEKTSMKKTLAELELELEIIKGKIAALQKPKMKKVRSLMTGNEIEIAEDTPWCCDPSSETYWSM
jgi:hypothetical protein